MEVKLTQTNRNGIESIKQSNSNFAQPQELVSCLQVPNSHTYVPLNSLWIKLKKLVADYPTTTGVATAIT